MRALFIFFLCLCSTVLHAQNGRVETLDAKAFDAKMKHIRHTLFDLRNAEEFSKEHIEGALQLSWPGKDAEIFLDKLKKYEPVYVYCENGQISERFARHLIDRHFSNVVFLTGGFEAWQKAGLSTKIP